MSAMAAHRTLRAMLRRPQALAAPLRATPLSRCHQPTSQCARRNYSSQTKPPNPTSEFYKIFTRPVGKVLVLAIFTYQVAYWTWAKLESDENCKEADATIAELEKKVDEYKRSKDHKNAS